MTVEAHVTLGYFLCVMEATQKGVFECLIYRVGQKCDMLHFNIKYVCNIYVRNIEICTLVRPYDTVLHHMSEDDKQGTPSHINKHTITHPNMSKKLEE